MNVCSMTENEFFSSVWITGNILVPELLYMHTHHLHTNRSGNKWVTEKCHWGRAMMYFNPCFLLLHPGKSCSLSPACKVRTGVEQQLNLLSAKLLHMVFTMQEPAGIQPVLTEDEAYK